MSELILPKSLIRREHYISRISPFTGKPLAKALTGPRRAGKSYMLFQIIAELRKKNPDCNIIYINLEDYENETLRSPGTLNDYITAREIPGKTNYIFIDEIQELPGFEKIVRSLLLRPNFDVYITGSNARLLSGEMATFLSGRTIEFNIYSLSYPEFLVFHQLTESEESFRKYLKFGGLPFLNQLPPEDEVIFEYLKNIYTTVLYRDIINRYNVRNTTFLEQLVRFLALHPTSLFSAKSISNFLKSQKINISHNQVITYLEYLVNSFMIHKADRYDIKGKRVFETGSKYYFENLGIRHSLVGFKPGDLAGALENLVFNHLLFTGYKVRVGTLGKIEIDFVAEKDHETIYVQVAQTLGEEKTIEREFGNLLLIGDNYPKIVVSMEPSFTNTYAGVRHMNIREFLMKENFSS